MRMGFAALPVKTCANSQTKSASATVKNDCLWLTITRQLAQYRLFYVEVYSPGYS